MVSEICLTMIPLSDLVMLESVKRGIESSIQIPAAAAIVAPETLYTETPLQRPPELYQRLTPLVTRFPMLAP